MERLQKYISESGLTSRRKAEELIKQGKVMVDGKVVTLLGTKVSGKEEIIVDNVLLKKDDKVYYLLNKPRGVVTTVKDDKERKTVVDLIETKKRIYPIGRLDYDTTGVLLLTNDGSFANMLMHPKSNIEKVYVAKLNGILSKDSINTLLKGVKIDNYIIKPDRIKVKKIDKDKNTCYVMVSIHDGKNHEIKNMFQSVGYLVDKLTRERYGFLTVDKLKSGEYRKLTIKEVHDLYVLANKK